VVEIGSKGEDFVEGENMLGTVERPQGDADSGARMLEGDKVFPFETERYAGMGVGNVTTQRQAPNVIANDMAAVVVAKIPRDRPFEDAAVAQLRKARPVPKRGAGEWALSALEG
jgi:hypothetical protein